MYSKNKLTLRLSVSDFYLLNFVGLDANQASCLTFLSRAVRMFQRSKTMTLRRNIVDNKARLSMVEQFRLMYSSLNCIPEQNSPPPKIDSDKSSASEFASSDSTSKKLENQQNLLQKLLNGEHHVFRKHTSQRRIPCKLLHILIPLI